MSSERHTMLKNLETAEEKRERWRSIYILYFSTFLMGLGFSAVLTGIWPYLDKLDPTAGKEFMGLIVAAHPLGQMIFSPLIGWWSNKIKTVHQPLLLCVIIFLIANVWYSVLELADDNRKYWMLATRFLTGISSSNMAICRSYLSAATTLEERTRSVSMIAFFQVLGFIIGPGLQAGFSPLGDKDYTYIFGVFPLNMYTAAGWLNVALGLINFTLFLPAVFKQKKIAAKEAMIIQNVETEKATWKNKKPDFVSAITMIISFFILNFHFVLLETSAAFAILIDLALKIHTPDDKLLLPTRVITPLTKKKNLLATSLTMDQFGWSKQDSLFYIGILMVSGALIACVAFFTISPLTKRFKETRVLVFGGFAFTAIGSIFLIPWGPHTPPMASSLITAYTSLNLTSSNSNLTAGLNLNSSDLNLTDDVFTNKTEGLGCPPVQEWCLYTPALTLTQFIISYVLTSMGYPIGLALIQTLISKVLGPRPQGTWMGYMVGVGCFARVMGPVTISVIYTRFGTIWTFSFTTVLQFAILFWLLYMGNRINAAIEVHLKRGKGENEKEIEMVNLTSPEGKRQGDGNG